MKTVVIVGASAAGLRCGSRLKRLQPDWRIVVVEKKSTFSWAACGLPYVLSGDINAAEELRKTADGALRDVEYFAAVKGVEILANRCATRIDTAAHTIELSHEGSSETLHWDELVLATGADAVRLPGQPDHPRVHTFHTFDDLQPLLAGLQKGAISSVAIIGGGFVGCELSEAFAALWGAKVTLFEAADTPLPALVDPEVGAAVRAHLQKNEVTVHTGAAVEQIAADDDGVTIATDGQTRVDAVVVALGVEPNVALAKSIDVRPGQTGAIIVNERLATNVAHVWAAGDCIEVKSAINETPMYLPLGSLANLQGRVLADVLAGKETRLPAACAARGLKVFDLNIAATGLTRGQAAAAGLEPRSVWISTYDKAHYWPEAKEIFLHLVYQPKTHKLLGAQAAGEGEVHKRIDVASAFIRTGATLESVAALEHAYAPPYAPALDPLAVAAMTALNQDDGVTAISPLCSLDGLRVLDVRHPDERETRPIEAEQIITIPQEELRSTETKLDGEWLVACERGTRSAEVVRWMQSHGARAQYLGGGLRWRALCQS